MKNTVSLTCQASDALIEKLFKHKVMLFSKAAELSPVTVSAFDFHNNQYITLCNEKTTILVYRRNEYLYLAEGQSFGAIRPRNMEQKALSHALVDDDIKMITVTGEAGTGKTLMTIAAALELVYSNNKYERLVLTKPRTQVTDGDESMGELPGDIMEKMAPQMASYEASIRKVWGANWKDLFSKMIEKRIVQVIPLEHMRGINFDNSIVICDEAQNVGPKQYKTLVTRMEGSSKLICMGDTEQADRVHEGKCPLLLTANHSLYKTSPITASIELKEVERGPLVDLMIRISNNPE